MKQEHESGSSQEKGFGSGHTFLKDLKPTSKNYKVKVKVAEKSRVLISPQKKTKFMVVTFKDDQVKGTLFENQIQEYGNIFEKDNTYEISNAPLQAVNERFATYEDECQIKFGGRTVVKPTAKIIPHKPNYIPLASIPYNSDLDDRFDILGLVLFISEIRIITNDQGIDHPVRDISMIDHSTTQPMTVSVWDDLTEMKDAKLLGWAEEPTIIGILNLRVATSRGFNLTSSLSTSFETNPTRDEFMAFSDRVQSNKDNLGDIMARLLDTKNPPKDRQIVTIQQIMLKMASNTLQEEKHWLKVRIPEPDQASLIAYIGCNKCGKKVDEPLDTVLTCPLCFRLNCVAVPRCTFKFDAADESDTMTFTAFTEDCEKLFKLTAAEIYEQVISGILDFGAIARDLSSNDIFIQIGPSQALKKHQSLSWVLKGVSWT